MSDMNGIGPGLDLSRMKAKQMAESMKPEVPDYQAGTPEFVFQVPFQLEGPEMVPSFSDACDEAARILFADGWIIDTFLRVINMGQRVQMHPQTQEPIAVEQVYEVTVQVHPTHEPF